MPGPVASKVMMGHSSHPGDGGDYARWRDRWSHLNLPDLVEAAVRRDEELRSTVVQVALEQLADSPRLRARFLAAFEGELARGARARPAAGAALLAVERAAIARRALRDLAGERRPS